MPFDLTALSTVPAADILGAMITPAVLISASGTLVLSTSNRVSRVVDRVRALARDAQHLPAEGDGRPSASEVERRRLVAAQLPALARRALLLRSALSALYGAIGLLVTTSLTVALSLLVGPVVGAVAVGTGLAGASLLLYGSLLLVREAHLAVGSTLAELELLAGATRGR